MFANTKFMATTAMVGLLAAASLAGPKGEVFAWSDAAGRPAMRDQRGIFIWHEGNTIFVSTQSERRKTTDVRATLRDGRITNVTRIRDERGDTITQPRDNEVIFRSRTWDGRDEMRFDIQNGKTLAIEVHQPREIKRPIYVGGGEMRADSNRVVIRVPARY